MSSEKRVYKLNISGGSEGPGKGQSKLIEIDEKKISRMLKEGYYSLENKILPRPIKYFDTDIATSIKRIKERDRILQKLPQIDCGCCGSPTCMAFAEDVVKCEVELTDCIVIAHKLNNKT